MQNSQNTKRTFLLSFLTIFIVSSAFFAADNSPELNSIWMDWVKPGENVEANQLHLKIRASHTPLNVKIYDGTAYTGIASLDAVADAFGVYELEKSDVLIPKVMDNPYASHIDRWYRAYFPAEFDVVSVLKAYENCPEVEVIEFVVIHKLLYVPNDPRFRVQWHLARCGFEEAWDVSHGSEDIVIGIVDSGIDMEEDEYNMDDIHEDLRDNVWINEGEDRNGDGTINLDDFNTRDDDHNGYIDDFFGWDFTGRDEWPNDPWGAEMGHGTHVAGTASSATDNEVGVSGPAFNCKLMIAACYNPNRPEGIVNGWQGIVYCAENDADVINLSWGSDSPFSGYENQRIQFALGEGSIIFAGSGNDDVRDYRGRNTHFYPCGYDGVIGVGASNRSDHKTDFSTYGDFIDLVAPGIDILSPFPPNDYASLQGTSMSSPFAAGLGALMLSVLPDLTASELLERMQETAVDISHLNEDYDGIQYRINADLLLNSTHPNFELAEWSYEEIEGNDNGRAEPHERIALPLTIGNLDGYTDAEDVRFNLKNDDESIRIERASGRIGDISSGSQIEVDADHGPRCFLGWSLPHYTTFELSLAGDDGWSETFDLTMTIGHPFYLLVDDDNADDDGNNEKDYTDIESFYLDDFTTLDTLDERHFALDTYDMYDEAWTPDQDWLNAFPVVVWSTGDARNPLSEDEIAVLQRYLDSGGNLILIGQYIGNDHHESEFFSEYLHVRHVSHNGGLPQLSGIEGNPISDGMQFLLIGGNAAGNSRSPSVSEPLEGAEALFNYQRTDNVGAVYYANDTYKVIYFGFALEAASGLGNTTLRYQFLDAAITYMYPGAQDADDIPGINLPKEYNLSQPWPNPFNSTTEIKVKLPVSGHIHLDVRDISGRCVATLQDGIQSAGTHSFVWNADNVSTGEYFFRLSWEGGSVVRKMVFLK